MRAKTLLQRNYIVFKSSIYNPWKFVYVGLTVAYKIQAERLIFDKYPIVRLLISSWIVMQFN